MPTATPMWSEVAIRNDADSASLLVVAAAIALGGFVSLRSRSPAVGLTVLLDLLTAAGLLRLAIDPVWPRAAAAGAVLSIRHLVTSGLSGAKSVRGPLLPKRWMTDRTFRRPGAPRLRNRTQPPRRGS